MPSCAKFLKDILSNKRRLAVYKTVALTQECRALIQNKLPLKLKDPDSFSIPCVMGTASFEPALCNLGAVVSVMPLIMCGKLEMHEMKLTTITLQLANRSIEYAKIILEDVPVKIGKFSF